MQLRSGNSARQAEREVANAEAPELEKVQWWSDPGLRKLYFFASILCLASATNGYDGYVGEPLCLCERRCPQVIEEPLYR